MPHANRSSGFGFSLFARGAGILIASASLSCAVIRAPLTSPAHGGAAWNELTSRHFVLQSDVDAEEARATITEFETLRAALAQVFPPRAIEPSGRIEIVLFDRTKDFHALTRQPQSTLAYFAAHLRPDLEAQPVLVLHSQLGEAGRSTFLHELAHRFLHQRIVDTPVWLDEGFAQLYSTLRLQNGKLTFGGRLPSADFSDRPFFWLSWYEDRTQLQIPAEKAPTVRALLDADRAAFYINKSEEASTEKDAERQIAYYTGAWKLVQLLVNGPDDTMRVRFQRFLDAIERGAKAKPAFHAAFDAAALDRLEQLFQTYLTEVQLLRAVTEYQPPTPSPLEREEVMSDARVRLLWARLMPWTHETGSAVRREIDAALASDPASSEARFLSAIQRFYGLDLGGARDDLNLALAPHPDEPRYLFGQLLWFKERPRKNGEPADDPAVIEAIVVQLARVAQTPAQLDAVASHYASRGRPSDAFAFTERALHLDPTCWHCEDTHAIVLLQVHRYPEALAAIERALALLPESEDARTVLAHRRTILATTAATSAPLLR
jgi:tetratricopeptide (TPR) repeat protein